MANLASFPLVVSIAGDNIATTAVINMGYTPTSATLVAAYDANYNSVSANISSVVVGSNNVTINFVAAFNGTILVQLALSSSLHNSPQIQPVSLGQSAGKTVIMKTGNLATTATTVDQVVLTYTVTAGKTFYLQYVDFNCRLTTYANTSVLFGAISLENPSGTKLITELAVAQSGGFPDPIYLAFAEPIPIAAGTVIRVVCTPAASTSFTWQANFGGYEK
jgi:hypothetical protein